VRPGVEGLVGGTTGIERTAVNSSIGIAGSSRMIFVEVMVLAPEALLDEVCCDDPERVAAALQAAHGRGDELVPGIIVRLQRVLAEAAADTDDDGPLIGFLFHLAAEFKATATHALIAQILRLGDDAVYELLGEIVTADGGKILADTYGGDPAPLIDLVEDQAAGAFERGAGLHALAILVHRGVYPRQDLLALMLKLAARLQTETKQDGTMADQLVLNAVRLQAQEIRGTILGLYERGLADEMFYESEYTDRALEAGAPPVPETHELDDRIESAWETLRHWAFFTEKPDDDPPLPDLESDDFATDVESEGEFDTTLLPPSPTTPYRAPPKVGRNEPCPCGSGKKFKKCCGR